MNQGRRERKSREALGEEKAWFPAEIRKNYGVGGKNESKRNSIKIGEICIVPRNVEEHRDVVECPRGNGNPGTKKKTNCKRRERNGTEGIPAGAKGASKSEGRRCSMSG